MLYYLLNNLPFYVKKLPHLPENPAPNPRVCGESRLIPAAARISLNAKGVYSVGIAVGLSRKREPPRRLLSLNKRRS